MLWKNALKYPVLIIGVLWMALYLTDSKTADFWTKFKYRFYPSMYICDSITERTIDKLDSNWSLHCPDTQYLIIRINGQDEILKILEKSNIKKSFFEIEQNTLRRLVYSRVFDSIVKFIGIADQDTLESLRQIKFNYKTERIGVVISSDGPALRQIRDQIYLVKVQRLHHRASVALKEAGYDLQFDKIKNGEFSKPLNIEEELWNKTLEAERKNLVQINLKRLKEKIGDKSSKFSLLLKTKEYTTKAQ